MSDRAKDLDGFDQEKLEALIEIMVLAASADGEFQAEERDGLEQALASLAPVRLGSGHLRALLAEIEARIASEGREARLVWVRSTLGDVAHRKLALQLAIQVMAADGLLRTSERELILEAAETLEIQRDAAADMVRAAGA